MTQSAKKQTGTDNRRTPDAVAEQDAIKLLKADHREVEKMFERFKNESLKPSDKKALAGEICKALTIHAKIEEEIFYPAARQALKKDGEDLLDEAEVEHGSLKELIAAITADEDDDLFDARVKVLGEYTKHHVKEEEGELFPKAKTKMDTAEIGAQMAKRKEELTAA